MPGKIHDLVPMLICEDVQRSIRFYTEVLGFEVAGRMDDIGKSGWACLRGEKAEIMLASPTYIPAAPRTDGRFTQAIYYFYVTDVVELREKVQAAGYDVSDLRVTFYNKKEFETVDPEGHVLLFGEETDEPPTPE